MRYRFSIICILLSAAVVATLWFAGARVLSRPRQIVIGERTVVGGVDRPANTPKKLTYSTTAKLPWSKDSGSEAKSATPSAAKLNWSSESDRTRKEIGVFADRAGLTPSEGRLQASDIHVAKATLTTQQASAEQSLATEARQPELPKFVMSMCLDLQGNLWVGSEGEGIFKMDAATRRWTKFTEKDGLGDDNGYGIACDRKGRIWVGHLNHGVSVFNGQKWQCYEVVGGLSRPDTLNGPLGERIFNVKCNPVDGDVWMASSCGLARYSESKDTWTFYTRADGLPSDQANALAFDAEGNIYVGTQCDGLAIAQAKDDYKTWRQVTGPDKMPTTPTGQGLPTNLINDVLVTKDQTLFIATTRGLAWSKDCGKTFQYVRGRDYADKVRGLYGGPPKAWEEKPGAVIAEDYVQTLADNEGSVALGFREMGLTGFSVSDGPSRSHPRRSPVSALVGKNGGMIVGGYGDGLSGNLNGPAAKITEIPTETQTMPSGCVVSTEHMLEGQMKKESRTGVSYWGEDWRTNGDWVDRYGNAFNCLAAMMSPVDHQLNWYNKFEFSRFMRRPLRQHDRLRAWIQIDHATERRTLFNPAIGFRRQAEWDDHGEVFSPSLEGPDIEMRLGVPPGTWRISMYFCNSNGREGAMRNRDYVVDVVDSKTGTTSRSRVSWFTGGVYKQFLVGGDGTEVQLIIRRNHSLNSICSGVFVDSFPIAVKDIKPAMPWMRDLSITRPSRRLDGDSAATTGMVHTAKDEIPMESPPPFPTNPTSRADTIQCYRKLLATRAVSDRALEQFRWQLPLWTQSDQKTVDDIFGMIEKQPSHNWRRVFSTQE